MEVDFNVWAWPVAVLGQGAVVALVAAAGLVAWQLSAVLLFFCLIVFLGIVANLETSRKQFGTFLWILICGQIFTLATLLSVYALATPQDPGEFWLQADADLVPLLPEVSDALDWVSQSDSFVDSYTFQDVLLFNSLVNGAEGLMATNLSSGSFETQEVRPGLFTGARGFTEFEGKLFFAAATAGGDELWSWDGTDSLSASLQQVQRFDTRLSLRSFRVYAGSLYIKVSWLVCGSWSPGVIRLQNESLALVGGSRSCSRPSKDSLMGELCMALLPLTILSALLMRSFPGLCVVLFFSLYGVIVVVWLLVVKNLEDLWEFGLSSFAAYSSVGFILVMFLHCRGRDDEWMQDLKRWSTVLVSASFCAAVQLRLDIPQTVEVWRWVVFAASGFVVQLMGSMSGRRFPLMAGYVVQLLVLAKLTLEVLEHLTTMQQSSFAAQRAIQLAFLAIMVGVVPPPEAVPFLQLGASQSVHPVQEAEPEVIGSIKSTIKDGKAELVEDDREIYEKTSTIMMKHLQASDVEPAPEVGPTAAMLELEEESAAASDQEEV